MCRCGKEYKAKQIREHFLNSCVERESDKNENIKVVKELLLQNPQAPRLRCFLEGCFANELITNFARHFRKKHSDIHSSAVRHKVNLKKLKCILKERKVTNTEAEEMIVRRSNVYLAAAIVNASAEKSNDAAVGVTPAEQQTSHDNTQENVHAYDTAGCYNATGQQLTSDKTQDSHVPRDPSYLSDLLHETTNILGDDHAVYTDLDDHTSTGEHAMWNNHCSIRLWGTEELPEISKDGAASTLTAVSEVPPAKMNKVTAAKLNEVTAAEIPSQNPQVNPHQSIADWLEKASQDHWTGKISAKSDDQWRIIADLNIIPSHAAMEMLLNAWCRYQKISTPKTDTISSYRGRVRSVLLLWCKATNLHIGYVFSEVQLKHMLDLLEECGDSPTTTRNKLSCLKMFLGFLLIKKRVARAAIGSVFDSLDMQIKSKRADCSEQALERKELVEENLLTLADLSMICYSPAWDKALMELTRGNKRVIKLNFVCYRGMLHGACLLFRSGRSGEPLKLSCERVRKAAPLYDRETGDIIMYRYRTSPRDKFGTAKTSHKYKTTPFMYVLPSHHAVALAFIKNTQFLRKSETSQFLFNFVGGTLGTQGVKHCLSSALWYMELSSIATNREMFNATLIRHTSVTLCRDATQTDAKVRNLLSASAMHSEITQDKYYNHSRKGGQAQAVLMMDLMEECKDKGYKMDTRESITRSYRPVRKTGINDKDSKNLAVVQEEDEDDYEIFTDPEDESDEEDEDMEDHDDGEEDNDVDMEEIHEDDGSKSAIAPESDSREAEEQAQNVKSKEHDGKKIVFYEEGDFVEAKMAEYNRWFNAQIIDVKPGDKYRVEFLEEDDTVKTVKRTLKEKYIRKQSAGKMTPDGKL